MVESKLAKCALEECKREIWGRVCGTLRYAYVASKQGWSIGADSTSYQKQIAYGNLADGSDFVQHEVLNLGD